MAATRRPFPENLATSKLLPLVTVTQPLNLSVILPKGESRFTGFDDKIISMYARGMTTRDIQGHLGEI